MTVTQVTFFVGHTDQIFSFAWSPCGTYCATVCKDGKIRVYNPRRSDMPVNEGKGPEGNRGARIVWALDGQYLVVSGFDKVSQRLISVYKVDDLENPLNTIVSDVSPSILIPFYDEDSSTLFLTGKVSDRNFIIIIYGIDVDQLAEINSRTNGKYPL